MRVLRAACLAGTPVLKSRAVAEDRLDDGEEEEEEGGGGAGGRLDRLSRSSSNRVGGLMGTPTCSSTSSQVKKLRDGESLSCAFFTSSRDGVMEDTVFNWLSNRLGGLTDAERVSPSKSVPAISAVLVCTCLLEAGRPFAVSRNRHGGRTGISCSTTSSSTHSISCSTTNEGDMAGKAGGLIPE